MNVFIERENKHLELEAKNGSELLKQLKIKESTVILVRNDCVVLPDIELNNGDDIKILSVVSGG